MQPRECSSNDSAKTFETRSLIQFHPINIAFTTLSFFFLDAPVCKSDQKLLYGVARHEPVKVSCEVEADPSKANFTWKFNNSVESMDLQLFVSEESRSIATYIPRTEYDYGTLLCWGRNSVGIQKEPCVFTVIPAGNFEVVCGDKMSNSSKSSQIG